MRLNISAGLGDQNMLTSETDALRHAQGTSSNKPVYLLNNVLVYVSQVKRMRHVNAAWGFFNLCIYRELLAIREHSMPLGKFNATAKLTGKTVAQLVREREII